VAENTRVGSAVLEQAAHPLEEAGIRVIRELLEGPLAEAILNVAAVRDCDLIIMGARGLSDLQGLLVGSVSHKVIQHAHCPVLVVR
jgi:nucleotide-binding universal stress UspA family protein